MAIPATLLIGCPTEPGGQSCNPDDCAPDEVRVLIDQCVLPLATGDTCSVADPLQVCPSTDACLAGTCKTVPGFGIGGACIAGEGCKFNTVDDNPRFCKSNTQCGEVLGLPPFYCAAGVRFGSACDSNFGAPACAACNPGLACVNGECRKSCTDANDCPCDASAVTAGYACEAGTCCRPLQQSCDSAAECCSGLTCTGGECCKPAGSSCAANGECCGDNICQNGACKEPCVAEQECQIPGAHGPCAAGFTVCDPAGNEKCVAVAEPSPEQCDGIDNDCDGSVDNSPVDLGQCTVHPTACENNPSLMVTVEEVCINGEKECNPVGGQDYCDGCEQMVGGQSCGPCATHACFSDSICAAGSYCNSETNICMWDEFCGPWLCWMPSDLKPSGGAGGLNCGP